MRNIFNDLPAELRLEVLAYCLDLGPLESDLGFHSPYIETTVPNVYITLALKDLLALYKSNPAGHGRGRFVKPSQLRRVCKLWRSDVEGLWGEVLVNSPVSLDSQLCRCFDIDSI